jgi:hypothetical protein
MIFFISSSFDLFCRPGWKKQIQPAIACKFPDPAFSTLYIKERVPNRKKKMMIPVYTTMRMLPASPRYAPPLPGSNLYTFVFMFSSVGEGYSVDCLLFYA